MQKNSDIRMVDKIEMVAISDLKPYENNARLNDNAVPALMESIKRFGFVVPIVITREKSIVCGHTRVKAASKLGMGQIPCVYADGLTEAEIRALRLADNKVSEIAMWDMEKLDAELASIGSEIDMSDFGFDFGSVEGEFSEEKNGNNQTGFSGEFGEEESEEEEEPISSLGREEKHEEVTYFQDEDIVELARSTYKHKFTLEELVSNIINFPVAMQQFNMLCKGYNTGYMISLLFNPHRLTTKVEGHARSVFDAFNNDPRVRFGIIKLAYYTTGLKLENQLWKHFTTGRGDYQYVNEFRPWVARRVYKRFCKDGFRILDPSAGWGGRTIGLASCLFDGIEYHACDPCTKTFDGLVKMRNWLGDIAQGFRYYNVPFEDSELEEDSFDFCFTSPPYFNLEKYSEESTQSHIRYSSYEKWKYGFLYKMMEKIISYLKNGGEAVINMYTKSGIHADILRWLEDNAIEHRILEEYTNSVGTGRVKNTTQGSEGEAREVFIWFRKN